MSSSPTKKASVNTAVEAAINAQIQAEFQSAYIYLAMSAKFNEMGFGGFAHWLRLQWEEETVHALKFYDFLLSRDGSIELDSIEKPEITFETPLEAFEQVLEHEQYITSRIHDLYDLATKNRDYPLQTLLNWFVDEQVEEEDSVRAVIDTLRLIGDSGSNLFLLDRELGSRQAEAE
ncbi:MAG: ferritin [Rhodothermales bacterium]